MKQILHFSLLLLILFSACTKQKEERSDEIVFDTAKAHDLGLADAKLLKKRVVELAFSDSAMIPAYTNLILNEGEYILYAKMTSQIFRFDAEGNFMNFIGRKGGGPSEYVEMGDILVVDNTLEVLDHKAIVSYRLNGEFIEKVELEIPAFSFALADNNYWFYVGDNPSTSQFRLIETDRSFTKINEYFPIREKGMPLVENNFSKNGALTFRETFNPKTYKLSDELTHTYHIDFGKLQVSEEILSSGYPFIFDKLMEIEYATIYAYMENNDFAFLQITTTKPNSTNPEMYYLIIDKKTNKEKLIRIKDFAENSYLLFPELISDNNTIYFVGYDIADIDEWTDDASNPSIIEISVEQLFKYKE